MDIALRGENTFGTSTHSCQVFPDEIRLLKTLWVGQDVCYNCKISCDETVTAKESPIGVCVAVGVLPIKQEAGVFLLVHFAKISKQERWRRWRAQCSEGGKVLRCKKDDKISEDVRNGDKDADGETC